MKVVCALLFCVSTAVAGSIKYDYPECTITKDSLTNVDAKTKEACIAKLFNQILQPCMYPDVLQVAKEYSFEQNVDKYLKTGVVRQFLAYYSSGMLPRGEIFVHTNEKSMEQAICCFQLLYFAKDFDTFIKTACFLREHINGGMFVYAFTAACFHRDDCKGVSFPAPYEIYPYYFVDSDVITKAFMMKMSKGVIDSAYYGYYGIQVTDNKTVMIDTRKTVKYTMSKYDKMTYFTEDPDMNSLMYYINMYYPYWMTAEYYGMDKQRCGEILMYYYQQLMARMNLECMANSMCPMSEFMWNQPLTTGYWPKILLPNGEYMPTRSSNVITYDEQSINQKRLLDNLENIMREAILTGKVYKGDGTMVSCKKPEDFEYVARMILGDFGMGSDDAKTYNLFTMFQQILSYDEYNQNKYTYVPTALDMYCTCLRDPVFWQIMKRVYENAALFKQYLPEYSRQEFDFPGVKVVGVSTDKLVTYMDEYNMDITSAVYMSNVEFQQKKPEYMFVAKQRRLNHSPFKVTIDVSSDKSVDSVVRVFLGPKYDCMGRPMSVNDKRQSMFEIDTFTYKLQTGKNTIVRACSEMSNFIGDRPSFRQYLGKNTGMGSAGGFYNENYWYKSRYAFPQRLMLPKGNEGGFPMQFYVIVSPLKTGYLASNVDMTSMQERKYCPWSTCFDTMPLGYPFDRPINTYNFFTKNMMFCDVEVYYKDLELSNSSKNVDFTYMVPKRDDLTCSDKDMFVSYGYKDTPMMSDQSSMGM